MNYKKFFRRLRLKLKDVKNQTARTLLLNPVRTSAGRQQSTGCLFQRRHRHSVFSLSAKTLQQTNLGALHGLQQVGERLFETADEHPTELLEQSAETRNGCPETHRQIMFIISNSTKRP